MITIDFSKRGSLGLCEYLYSSIKTQILDGTLKANEKLPSKRALSENLGVSVITVQNAYAELIAEGYIYSIEKKGFFVTELRIGSADEIASVLPGHFENLNHQTKPLNHQIKPLNHQTRQFDHRDNSVVEALETTNSNHESGHFESLNDQNIFCDFQSNSTSYEKFPFSLWSHTMRQVLSGADEKLLQRVEVKGVYELRESISKYLREFRNMNVSPEQIVIGAGTENIFSMIVQFLGRENVFALENPGYKKIASVCRLNGAKIVPVNIDEHGINIEELEKSGANVAHVSPNHHFPTGIVMPIRRRQEILSWAASEKNRFIIEDDYDSEFRFNGKPLSTLFSADQNGKVIYINTFSKTLSPSFRISFMVLPFELLSDFENLFGLYSCPVSSFEQFTLSRFINDGNYGKHIIRMKNFYRNLRNSLIFAIQSSRLKENCKIREEESGLHFLLSIKSELSAAELEERLLREGINLPLLSNYYYENETTSENANEERELYEKNAKSNDLENAPKSELCENDAKNEKSETSKNNEDFLPQDDFRNNDDLQIDDDLQTAPKSTLDAKNEKLFQESEKTFVVNYSGIRKEKITEIVQRMERAILGK